MRETLRTAVIREILLSLRSFVGDCVSSSTTSTFARLLKDLPELSQLLDVLKGYWLGAMSGPRRHFVMGLVLLLCALTGSSVCAPSAALPTGYAQQRGEKEDYRQLMEAIRHADETKSRSSARGDAPITSRSRIFALEARDSRSPRTDRREPVPTFPRNSKKKGKFLQHMTGPLYFSHRCRKHAYRLYHQTRDCTIPAYYKRCARLLTRLAGSPQCMEG